MLDIGTLVIYGTSGIFRVEDIRNENLGGGERKYYILSDINEKNPTTVFVPTDNEHLVSKMKQVISENDAKDLISNMPLEPYEWIPEARARNEFFKKIIESGEREALLRLMRTVYLKKQELSVSRKHVYATDESAMKSAERIIFSELTVSLGVDEDEIINLIEKRVCEASA